MGIAFSPLVVADGRLLGVWLGWGGWAWSCALSNNDCYIAETLYWRGASARFSTFSWFQGSPNQHNVKKRPRAPALFDVVSP
jgi:hypothetical protein